MRHFRDDETFAVECPVMDSDSQSRPFRGLSRRAEG